MNFPFIDRYQPYMAQVLWGPLFIAFAFYLENLFPTDKGPLKKTFFNIFFIIGLIFAAAISGLFKFRLLQYNFEQSYFLFFSCGILAGVALIYCQKFLLKFSTFYFFNIKILLCFAGYLAGLIFLSTLKMRGVL